MTNNEINKIIGIAEQIRKIELLVEEFKEKEIQLHEDLKKINFTEDKELEEIKLDILYYTNKINRALHDFIITKKFAENEINKKLLKEL